MAKGVDKNLSKLPLGAVRPEGWLLSEIEHMCNLQKRLGALQGLIKNGEWTSGEFFPRYLRGLILIASALDDKNLKDKASTFVQLILNSMVEGGDFGPRETRTLTPKIEAIKTLLCYYELTNDERILPFIKRYFKFLFNTYSVSKMWFDSRARLLDLVEALEAVYRETDLEWLQDLGEKLRDSTTDWFVLSKKFPYKKPYHNYISQTALRRLNKTINSYAKTNSNLENPKLKEFSSDFVESKWKQKSHKTAVETSGINIAKAIKYPSTYGRFVGDDDLKNLSIKMIESLLKYHGTPMGTFTCDTRLEGLDKFRGTDVQSAVEMMESLVEVIKETTSFECCDILERIAFNFIPAACFDDCSAVQDLLLTNQVEASNSRSLQYSDMEYGNAYLTKKISKGSVSVLSAFPILMQTACMTKNDEMFLLSYMPCTMDVNIGGCRLTINEKTGYPFRNTIVFKVEKATGEPEVKMNFRVPRNTTMQLISGGQVVASGTKIITVRCVLKTGSTFMLKLNIPLVAETNVDDTISLYKGNILLSLKMPYEINVSQEDRRILSVNFTKKWAIAPVLSKRTTNGVREVFEEEKTTIHEIGEKPFNFDEPPFEIKIRSKNVLNWDYNVDGFTIIPKKSIFSEESLERTYLPYGCSLLHIGAFPKCIK